MTLYLVATPIGHLEDISLRALRILKEVDYILCEDTRHSGILLHHYEISIPLRPFHKFKEAKSQEGILQDLRQGKNIALISDAGTPLLADPGESLVAECRKENLPVTALPGACALTTALILSGLPTSPFQFVGFFPKKEQELRRLLQQILLYSGTTVGYESPHRILSTLQMLEELEPEREICLLRELTKWHEQHLYGTAKELCAHFNATSPRGEMVLLVAPKEKDPMPLPFKELALFLQQKFSLDKKEAIRLAAEIGGVPKREVYSLFLEE